MLLEIIIATFIVSLASLVGLIFTGHHIEKKLHLFISFAAATLLSVSFFDMVPHSLEEIEGSGLDMHFGMMFILLGVTLFFLIERFIHWHHCDKEDCSDKPAGILILTGDFVHNFIDGLLIASSFMLNFATGIATTITVLIHEIPQEFGDFSVLIHSGFSKKKALLLNFYSALSSVLGGIVGYFAFDAAEKLAPFAVLIAAGGFLYIALSDIVPSMHKHKHDGKTRITETFIFVGTMIGFYFLVGLLHGQH
ncbi:ZIP family metal transporter [Candidatus Woesearchaeota archaeon]|nr:ZIP family metal transporter [Candidatus Woesearchaeota archaeon]